MQMFRWLLSFLGAGSAETRGKTDLSWEVLSQIAPPGAAYGGRLAENLSTVLACVNAISTAIASLPAEVQRRRGDSGWETDESHPVAQLTRDGVNEHQSWTDYIEWLVASTLLTGNGLSEVHRDRKGQVRALTPIMWGGVGVQQLPSGRLAFDVSEVSTIPGASGRSRRLLEDEVLLLRDRTDDGLIGRSRLQRAPGVLQPAADLQQFTTAMWRNGINPSGVLETDKVLNEQSLTNLRKSLDELTGSRNAARPMILEQGLKWRATSVSPEDAELLDSRRFTVEELARIFNVPPPVIGDLSHGSFTNSETMIRWFAQATLSPWIAKIEHEFQRSVFGAASRRTHRLHLDLSGLLRGDPETRWTSHKTAVEAGILTPNEVRDIEGWNPIEGGESLRQSSAPQNSQANAA
ncbi:MAG: phage portal protein [Proteobacteria bacterium]|nr:phage portal protein [Pseudomonadota bacterium]